MSVEATSWAWTAKVKSSAQRLILLSLADRAGEHHKCYPSNARLAQDTCLNPKTVQKVVNELIALGLVVDTGSRKGTTNQVRVLQLVGVQSREKTQHRDDDSQAQNEFNDPKNGTVKATQKRNSTEIGNDAKNGIVETIPKLGSLQGVTTPILEGNDPNFGVCNDPNFGVGNLSLNLKGTLSCEQEWRPDEKQFIEKLKFAGKAMEIDSILGLPSFEFELGNFNAHYENQVMSESKKMYKFVTWMIDKFERHKKFNPDYAVVTHHPDQQPSQAITPPVRPKVKPVKYGQGFNLENRP